MKAKNIFSLGLLLLTNYLLAQSWQTVGTAGFSTSEGITHTSISFNATGVPYVAYVNGGNIYTGGGSSGKATVMKYNGSSWVTVGAEGFTGVASNTTIKIAPDGTPFLLYADFGETTDPSFSAIYSRPTVKKFDGTNWVNVGLPRFSSGWARYPSLAIDKNGTPWVLYLDGNTVGEKATVKKFNGTIWETVGTEGFSASGSHYTSIAIDQNGIPYVAYSEWGNGYKVTVKKFDGTNWVTVGTEGFSANGTTGNALAIDNSGVLYIVFQDASTNKGTVMKFTGTQWILVGGSVPSDDTINDPTITIDSENRIYIAYHISFSQNCTGGVSVKSFENNTWNTVIGSSCISSGSAQHPAIDLDVNGIPYVAYVDNSNGISQKATVSKFIKGNQTIAFNSTANRLMTDPLTFTLNATSNSSLPISYSSNNPDVATVSANVVTVKGEGSVTITASQNGNTIYNAATSVDQLLTISKANQTISFSSFPASSTFDLIATASSGLPVTFSNSNPDVAVIQGNTVTVLASGTSQITASQPGDNRYKAAPDVTQTLVAVIAGPETESVSFKIYPNPASEYLRITVTETDITKSIIVYQMNGKIVDRLDFSDLEINLAIAHYSPGIYQIRVISGNTNSIHRFVKY